MIMLQLQDLTQDQDFKEYLTLSGVLEKTVTEQKIAKLYWQWFNPAGLDDQDLIDVLELES
jgi:hypothetical protein